jgi:TadE-like protein
MWNEIRRASGGSRGPQHSSLAGQHRRKQGHGEEAQAVLEILVIFPVLLLFFLGSVDFARFMYYSGALQSAARVGAEAASNHCPYAGTACGQSGTAVSDTFVIWATYCEAATAVNLNLGQYPIGQPNTTPSALHAYKSTTISPCTPDDTSKTWTPTCNTGSSCANCTNDICVAPSTRASSTQVSVSVGYDFRPITPLMDRFFSNQQCWLVSDTPAPLANDPSSNNHTLSARALGGVY